MSVPRHLSRGELIKHHKNTILEHVWSFGLLPECSWHWPCTTTYYFLLTTCYLLVGYVWVDRSVEGPPKLARIGWLRRLPKTIRACPKIQVSECLLFRGAGGEPPRTLACKASRQMMPGKTFWWSVSPAPSCKKGPSEAVK